MSEYNRAHRRLPFKGTIFIEQLSSGATEQQNSEILRCQTLDVSHDGLRVGTNCELTVGAILQIGIELSGEENTLYLTGEVIWCARDDRGQTLWEVGFKLMNASDSDIDTWRALLNKMAEANETTNID